MKPRLATSKKWTPLPGELVDQIREIFHEGFEEQAKGGKILVEGRIYPGELMLRVGFVEKGRLKQANFEVSLDFNAAKQNAMEQIHFAVDCAASMLEDFFEKEGDLEEFPISWKSFDISGRKVFLQVSTENSELESAADKILGKDDSLLVREASLEDEEAEVEGTVKKILGIDDIDPEDSDDDSGSSEPDGSSRRDH